jgi:hypothetical protein
LFRISVSKQQRLVKPIVHEGGPRIPLWRFSPFRLNLFARNDIIPALSLTTHIKPAPGRKAEDNSKVQKYDGDDSDLGSEVYSGSESENNRSCVSDIVAVTYAPVPKVDTYISLIFIIANILALTKLVIEMGTITSWSALIKSSLP